MKTGFLLAVILATAAMAQMPDKFGYVQTKVTPATAGVFLDGKYMGPSSLYADKARAIRVPAGNHRVEIVDPYHVTVSADLQVADGQYNEISREMKANGKAPAKKAAAIVTEGFGEAAIYLDKDYFGHAGRELRVKPGKYMVKIRSMDGTILRELKVELDNGETITIPKDGTPIVKRAQ